MPALPRLRQVALVARDCEEVAARLRDTFGWPEPFHDAGVGEFGLVNAVFAAGDTFVEVVAPAREGTTAGRYLDRRGGDGGYMAIFQVADIGAARDRAAGEGIRIVWKIDLPDVAGTHLHPADVAGAIVSLDWAEPPESWRWAGPAWTGTAPPHPPGGIRSITVEVEDPAGACQRWAHVIGVEPDGTRIRLAAADQVIRFAEAAGSGEGITEVILTGESPAACNVGSARVAVETQPAG